MPKDDRLEKVSLADPGSRLAKPPSADIAAYYRQTMEDYLTWSRKGYMHFGFWRSWSHTFHRERMIEAMNDLVFSSLRLDRSTTLRVADLGCGTGAVSRYGGRQFPSHRWHAVTLSPEQVAYGRSRCQPEDLERMEMVQADYCCVFRRTRPPIPGKATSEVERAAATSSSVSKWSA